jgi:tRNA(Met) cytidine acetyltransferase
MDLAARLREEAGETGERRLLVLAGSPSETRERVSAALAAADIDTAAATYVGPDNPTTCNAIEQYDADQLLGTTQAAVILDCHQRCEPNTLARVSGCVDGGGLLVLLTPPLDSWPSTRDAFDESLAVPPFDVDAVGTQFRERLVETLRAHRGVAIVDVDSDDIVSDGLTNPAPRLNHPQPTPPRKHDFPQEAYEACRTQDQVDALAEFERLETEGEAIVVEANRGRGKSSVAGLAAASLARQGMDVAVTAPAYRNSSELFARASELADVWSKTTKSDGKRPQEIEFESGRIRYVEPVDISDLADSPDRLFVDEAAALPVSVLAACLAAPGVAFTTTVHGYEGAGMGFTVRFREHLDASELSVTDVSLGQPIRYAPGDPIEVWSFRALALDARPPVEPLVADATTDTVEYRQLSAKDLRSDEQLLREVFGLLVLAHYRTEPNDFARLLDAPNVSVHALLHDGHPVSVALLAREGGLPEDLRSEMYDGARIKGNLIPDLLTSQLRDREAAIPVGQRILRIATHDAVRSRGLGSMLLSQMRHICSDADWLGVGFGATPGLLDFWRRNDFRTVHLATSRSERSGEHSAIMLDPQSAAGHDLLDRHTEWFLERLPATLTDSLAHLDPDVVRAVCRTIDGSPPLALSDFEWQLAAGIATGRAILATSPRPVRRLTLSHLVGGDEDLLTETQERLLVHKTLQCHDWESVSRDLDFGARSNCKRALSDAVRELVGEYGDETTLDELDDQ